MSRKSLRIAALTVAVIVALGAVYGRRIFAWQSSSGEKTVKAPVAQRKILYYYDAMNPQNHYDKPGKAPDGIGLVPQYADEATSGAGQSASAVALEERKVLYWYDPMHPAYKSDKPGIAPDCGMPLVPKYTDEETSTAKTPTGAVTISPEKQQLIGVRTAKVERQPLSRSVRTTAQLTADETKIAHVHVKVSGYIEKVYVDYVGQLIKKGQPLFTLYSPDLVATQEEYLISKRGEKYLGNAPYKEVSDGANSLLKASRDRLKLWEISDEQIKKLDE